MRKSTLLPVAASLLLGSFFCSGVQAKDTDKMHWSITPYLWATNTKVDLSVRDIDLGSPQISFSDLLDVIDSAFMLQVEGGKGRWSVFGDLTVLETSDANQRPVFLVNSNSEQVILDAAVAYWPEGIGEELSVYGGVRYTDFDDRYRFSSDGMQVSQIRSAEAYYDALVGMRYRYDLAPRWQLLTRGDVSFGDSEGQYLLRANFAYLVGKRRQNQILFGYQYKKSDFKDDDLTKDFTYNGVMAGFSFQF